MIEGAYLRQHFQPAEAGQAQVEQHQIKAVLLYLLQSGLPIRNGADLIAMLSQVARELMRQMRLIIHNKNTDTHPRLSLPHQTPGVVAGRRNISA